MLELSCENATVGTNGFRGRYMQMDDVMDVKTRGNTLIYDTSGGHLGYYLREYIHCGEQK